MNRLIPQKSYYEVDQFLGEGLTSQVYKAFRIDDCGYTKQLVALKIVKSKNHIQVLRKEFEKLQSVNSKHCVKVYAWENLKKGPALVLELLDGVTLEALWKKELLTKELIVEILSQVQEGLRDIHKQGLVHGDLNLKNIFITPEGVVKLLDFGVLHNIKDFLGTPQFMAPEVWKSCLYKEPSDLFSLGLIGEFLRKKDGFVKITKDNWQECLESFYGKNTLLQENPEHRVFLPIKMSHLQKKKLGCLVKKEIEKSSPCETLQIKANKRKKRSKTAMVLAFVTLCFLVLTPTYPERELRGELSIRSHHWTYVSVNGMPEEIAPLSKKNLRVGRYTLRWKRDGAYFKKEVQILPKQTFILKPHLINL